MDFSYHYTQEQQDFRRTVTEWLDRNVPENVDALYDSVEGAEALAWGAEQNRATHAALAERQPGFDALRTHLWALVFRFLREVLGDA